MIFDAQDFSRFEFCPRQPQLYKTFAPPRWPIRYAVKRFLESGIRNIMRGESVDSFIGWFIESAANPGYLYPDGEPYILAQDHACWLDGALRLIQEEVPRLEPLPLYKVGEHFIHVEGYTDGERAILFRASSSLGDSSETLRWPELCVSACDGKEITSHIYRLPQVRNGRLLSPLCTAYQHPTFVNIQYRLARLYDEPEFKKSWKKIGRWEIQPPVEWDEWRRGIDKDKCLDAIREIRLVQPLDSEERRKVLYDIEAMAVAQERPSMYPRYRERCPSCIFQGLCHGTEESRSQYQVVGEEELERYQRRMAEINT